MTTITVPDFIYAQSLDRIRHSGPHPAQMVVFTDQGSFWHVVMGIVAGTMPEPLNLGTVALFSGYELSKQAFGESPARTGGKFVEFGIGLVLAGLVRMAGGIG